MSTKKLLQFGLAGSLILSLAEFSFHYISWATAQTLLDNQLFLAYISEERLIFGYILLLVGAPLYYLGYLGVFNVISSITKKPPYLFLCAAYFMLTIGIIWISARPVVVLLVQNTLNLPLIHLFQEITITLVRVLLFGVSLYLFLTLQGATSKISRLLSAPFMVWASIFLGFFIFPSLFWPFLLIAFNIAHVVFFTFILITHKAYE